MPSEDSKMVYMVMDLDNYIWGVYTRRDLADDRKARVIDLLWGGRDSVDIIEIELDVDC